VSLQKRDKKEMVSIKSQNINKGGPQMRTRNACAKETNEAMPLSAVDMCV
jgi:hypothetical protein